MASAGQDICLFSFMGFNALEELREINLINLLKRNQIRYLDITRARLDFRVSRTFNDASQ